MPSGLQIFIFLPVNGFLISLIHPERDEKPISRHRAGPGRGQPRRFVLFLADWALRGFPPLS